MFVRPGSPLNSATGIGMGAPVTPAEMDALEDFYHSRGAAVRLHVCPLADESLFHELARRAYALSFFFSALYLPIPVDFAPGPLPAGLRITPAGADEADTWLNTVAVGFEAPDAPGPESLDILGPNFHAPESVPYFAWMDGQPAGGGGMYYHEGVVELGGASTVPSFRRRGIQRALIEARLAHARKLGCDLALVLTEPGSDSQRNLQRAGFQLAYTKLLMEKEAAR